MNRRLKLGDPSWQGVGAIAGIAGAIIAVIVALPDSQSPAERTPERRPSDNPASNTNINQGNCNIIVQGQATDIEAHCAEPSRSVVGGGYGASDWVFIGAPESLPAPPDYPPDEVGYHCDRWRDWLSATKAAYADDFGASIYLQAGQSGVVAITGVTMRVVTRRPAELSTRVRCGFGGSGKMEGSYAVVRTAQQRTDVYSMPHLDDQFVHEGQMPPAIVYVNDNHASMLLIQIDSVPGYLYEGIISATIVKDGVTSVLTIGTPERPLRWLGKRVPRFFGGVDPSLPAAPENYYGWDTKAQQWVLNYYPFR